MIWILFSIVQFGPRNETMPLLLITSMAMIRSNCITKQQLESRAGIYKTLHRAVLLPDKFVLENLKVVLDKNAVLLKCALSFL